ncbi:MAG TPA: FtsX-like permease family protein [Rectinemataceae bacterium]|nr:FtsX-like permease family protein [Rectinemataceae bacterium]
MRHFAAIAFKNIFRQKKRSFTLGINYAIVTFILVLLFAFSHGASVNIESNLVRATAGHITISGQYASAGRVFNGILRTGTVIDVVHSSLGADSVVLPRYQVQSTLYYKGLSKRLTFVGIDTKSDTGFRDQMKFGAGGWDYYAADPNGVLVPADAAGYFGLANGDEVVISTRTRFGAFNTGILRVRGIYTSDDFFSRGNLLTHFDFLRSLDLADADASTTIYVYLHSASGLSAKRDRLSAALAASGFEVSRPKTDSDAIAAISAASTKYEADKEGRDRVMLTLSTLDEVLGIVRSVLGAVNGVGALVAAIMLFVIAVSIFINLRMTINERLREIGTMRAIGVESGGVAALFVLESLILALLFSGGGAVLATFVSFAVRYLVLLPTGGNLGIFMNAGHLVLIPRFADIAAIIAAVALFSALFSWFPARRGGRIPPVEALTATF